MATDAEVLEVLRIKLVAYQGAGMTVHASNVQSRIKALEKKAAAGPEVIPKEPAAVKGPAPKAAKKAARKSSKK